MSPPPPTIQRVTFLLIFSLAFMMLGVVLWPFWTQLFLAFLLATVFHPAYLKMTARIRPWMAASLTCLLIILCVFLPLLFSIGALSAEIPGSSSWPRKTMYWFCSSRRWKIMPICTGSAIFSPGTGFISISTASRK